MTARFSFWPQIAAWGFLLNMVWEFGQCLFLYDMWSRGFWRGAAWMWGAIIGNVGIVLGVVARSRLIIGPSTLRQMRERSWVVLLAVRFVATLRSDGDLGGGPDRSHRRRRIPLVAKIFLLTTRSDA